MFIDSSALTALLLSEPDAPRIANAIETAEHRYTSGLVRLETVIVTATKLNCTVEDAQDAFDRFIAESAITVTPITDAIARKRRRRVFALRQGARLEGAAQPGRLHCPMPWPPITAAPSCSSARTLPIPI